ncbi:MAG: ATP-binding protein [Phycisphaerae bacterium]|nr:ATP-binding protein [Phycisphaerae bacterium]
MQIIQGPDQGLTVELSNGQAVIGRVNADIELHDGTVSRVHARLTRRNGQWMLDDMGSANGTFLNGMKVGKASPLKRGDQIRCGSTLLVFGGVGRQAPTHVDLDEEGKLIDAAIVATVPSNEDSVIIPTPEAGAAAIGNLRILYDHIADVGRLFDVDALLQRTLELIFTHIKADRGYVLLVDDVGNLTLKASRLRDEQATDEAPISRTIVNEVIQKQVGVLSTNAMSDSRFAAGKSVHDFGIRSAICVPIKGRERILGVIQLDCGVSEQTYSTEQLRLLTAIGYQTGLAMENVRLYEASVQRERLAAVGETVAFVSHHIKNLLQALSAGMDVVGMGLDQGKLDKAKTAWPIAQRSLGRIHELILNMLAYSKNRLPLLEDVNINEILQECVDMLTPRADERGVAMLCDLDDIPAVPADSAGLHQVFMNLLTNALEAVKDHEGVITVATSCDAMSRQIAIHVHDNGSGIDAMQMLHIWEPFWSSKGQSGTGLGLAVAKKVVAEHRGTIDATSLPGEGTTFTINLPTLRTTGNDDTVA